MRVREPLREPDAPAGLCSTPESPSLPMGAGPAVPLGGSSPNSRSPGASSFVGLQEFASAIDLGLVTDAEIRRDATCNCRSDGLRRARAR